MSQPDSQKEAIVADPNDLDSHLANDAPRDRVRASIENWKRKLLDLTKRNRALNFRMNKVSTIAIVDEQPAEVFRQLFLRERAMRFNAAAEDDREVDLVEDAKLASNAPPKRPSVAVQTESLPFVISGNAISADIESVVDPEDEDESLGLEFAPYDAASLDEKYTDDWLQTASKPEMLDKSLRRLDEQARGTIEEQGVNTLYLSLGMLHYTESADSKQVFKAPLILLPVQLKRSSARSGYQLLASGEDPLVNPALAEFLRSNFGLMMPELPDSQSMPEDYDLVVVGDPKQLPPTNFFQVTSGQANVQIDDEGNPLYEDSESILENFMGAGAANSRLKWHYRSTHESLINFSNVNFYDKDLYTFPSVETDSQKAGLQFEYVADGVYEGKGLNQNEARRVADAVVRFAKEQSERVQRGEPALSLGVGTFNLRQQLAIQDELELRRRQESSIEPFFNREKVEPFFVKNLENIQGDERDVIYLSITYARSSDGKLRYNFGPLNSENGWRRLNVITTRARQRMRVFSSMKGDEINLAATASPGPRLLREFLLYAEHGRLESTIADAASKTDSDFELDVMNELTRRNITVVPQVGVAGYRIDLGVLDDATPGRFLCGIECDGVAYHNSETARDRDRLRQEVLEARGWTMFRVWSTDWFKDRQGQIARLITLIEAMRTRAIEEAQAEKDARERFARENEIKLSEESEVLRQEAADLRASALHSEPYQRPVAAPYVTTAAGGYYLNAQLLAAPLGDLVKASVLVIETESPIHQIDLAARVAAMWGQRAGPRIQSRIMEACRSAENRGVIQRRAEFYWSISTPDRIPVRSRFGTKIPANRVAPEEYREAITLILAKGQAFSRHELVKEVRAVFGFSRTGAILDEAINREVDFMLQAGKVGEGSTGIRLRT